MSGNTETPITITKSDKDHFETQTVYTDTINCNGCLTFTNTAESINNRTIGEHGTGVNSEIFNCYEGNGKNDASGDYSHAEGFLTRSSGNYSHAECYGTIASNDYSHAEGVGTKAEGKCSHTEGNNTRAPGSCSHTENFLTNASGIESHAEGYGSIASGNYSHAEGFYTSASGVYSHTHNYYTIADNGSMTAIGKYNISNTNEQVNNKKNKLFVVGNGTSSSSSDRQDVFIITETGDVFISGNLYINDKLYYNIGDTNWISNTYFDSIQ